MVKCSGIHFTILIISSEYIYLLGLLLLSLFEVLLLRLLELFDSLFFESEEDELRVELLLLDDPEVELPELLRREVELLLLLVLLLLLLLPLDGLEDDELLLLLLFDGLVVELLLLLLLDGLLGT